MAEERTLEQLQRSKYWRWQRDYLLARREQIFRQQCSNTSELWQKEGALHEINRLLRGPALVLEWYKQRRESSQRDSDLSSDRLPGGFDSADGESSDGDFPHGPAFVET